MSVEIVSLDGESARFIHPLLGELTVPRTALAIVRGADDPRPSMSALAEAGETQEAPPADAPPPEAPPPAPAPPPEWKFKLIVAAGGASGNTENANANVILAAVRETPEMKTVLDSGYFFDSSDGDRSQNRFTVGGRNDWLNPDSRWFYFADARYDLDEFQSWDSRVSGHLGIGYRLIQPPKLTLNLLAGLGAVKEWGSSNDNVRAEALLGVEGKYEFAEKHTLVFSSTLFPDLSDPGEYRWVNNAGWSFLMDEKNKLSLTAGVQHEYQTVVDTGREHSDVRVLVGLQLDF
jgi:putative salt-induced outer membrane protein YdiY